MRSAEFAGGRDVSSRETRRIEDGETVQKLAPDRSDEALFILALPNWAFATRFIQAPFGVLRTAIATARDFTCAEPAAPRNG
jgi:hypothetical protein